MINICNIFNPITKETGNYLLLSQYTDDLSRSAVDVSYRVSPSRFVCMFLTPEDIVSSETESLTDPKDSLPGFFQNEFENGISNARSNSGSGWNYDKHNFSVAFWQKMSELTQVHTGATAGAVDVQNKIKYVGNIAIESWHDGFADVLIDILSGSKGCTCDFNQQYAQTAASWVAAGGADVFKSNCGAWTYNNTNQYIIGWSSTDNIPISGSVPTSQTIGIGSIGTINGLFDSNNGNSISVFDNMFDYSTTTNDPFTFNTVVLLYDIVNQTTNGVIAKDIPMAVYFTGSLDPSTLAIMNPVTIYPTIDDAYGAGSGWSLRISTRFSPTPHGYLKVEEVATQSGALYNTISALMAANAESIKIIQSFADESIYNSQTIKDLYAIFKNNRTNVPYIKDINGTQYWFVNGRNTGTVTSGLSEASRQSIQNLFVE